MEKEKDFEQRREKFLKKYKELIDEVQCDFASYPQYIPDDKKDGSFKLIIITQVMDTKNLPKPSPFIK